MKLGRLFQIALIAAAVLMLAASAGASTIYNTNSAATEFTTGGLVLDSTGGTGGATATLTFDPLGNTTVGPGNISYGTFVLACSGCSTQTAGTAEATFGSFTFDLYIDDTTDNAIEEFVGTFTGPGTVYSDSSNITINWAPTQMGPGAATGPGSSGNFNTTFFTITTPTPIVAPSSNGGQSTVEGTMGTTAVPEPATMALAGGLLVGLAGLARRRRA